MFFLSTCLPQVGHCWILRGPQKNECLSLNHKKPGRGRLWLPSLRGYMLKKCVRVASIYNIYIYDVRIRGVHGESFVFPASLFVFEGQQCKRVGVVQGFYLLLISGESESAESEKDPQKNVWHLQKAGLFEGFLRKYPPRNEHIPYQGTFEDDFPCRQVGYVIVPWRVLLFHLSPLQSNLQSEEAFFFSSNKTLGGRPWSTSIVRQAWGEHLQQHWPICFWSNRWIWTKPMQNCRLICHGKMDQNGANLKRVKTNSFWRIIQLLQKDLRLRSLPWEIRSKIGIWYNRMYNGLFLVEVLLGLD